MIRPITYGDKAILFDMDGVLWDTAATHSHAYQSVLQDVFSDFSYHDHAGMSTDHVFASLAKEFHADVPSLVASKRQLALSLLETRNPVPFDLKDALAMLDKKYTLALVSNASRASVELFLRLNDLTGFFQSVSWENKMFAYAHTQSLFMRDAKDCIVVEDSVYGVEQAAAYGIPVCGLSPYTTTRWALKKAGAIHTVNTLTEFAQWMLNGQPL